MLKDSGLCASPLLSFLLSPTFFIAGFFLKKKIIFFFLVLSSLSLVPSFLLIVYGSQSVTGLGRIGETGAIISLWLKQHVKYTRLWAKLNYEHKRLQCGAVR